MIYYITNTDTRNRTDEGTGYLSIMNGEGKTTMLADNIQWGFPNDMTRVTIHDKFGKLLYNLPQEMTVIYFPPTTTN